MKRTVRMPVHTGCGTPLPPAETRWKPGQSGNPKGRPVGSRVKLGEAFLADLYEAWEAKGKAAINRVINRRPDKFLTVVAACLPKELKIETGPFEGLSDDDLTTILDAIRSSLAAEGGRTDRSGETPPTQH
jgi:hypothetical protein